LAGISIKKSPEGVPSSQGFFGFPGALCWLCGDFLVLIKQLGFRKPRGKSNFSFTKQNIYSIIGNIPGEGIHHFYSD
jgi:hypothetical protein